MDAMYSRAIAVVVLGFLTCTAVAQTKPPVPTTAPAACEAARKQATPPRFTDLMSPEEAKQCGLAKLNPDEIASLNKWMMAVFVKLSAGSTGIAAGEAEDEMALFSSTGTPVAYIAGADKIVYLWSGQPVGYVDDDSIFGFNGKHVAWYASRRVYDHDGKLIAAAGDQFRAPPVATVIKGLKGLEPLKELKELKPLKPVFITVWSDHDAKRVLAAGGKSGL